MIKSIDHIGIALPDYSELGALLGNILKLASNEPEEVADQRVSTWSFKAGESEIELLVPTSEDSPIAKYIENKGAGLHHIAFRVDDIDSELAKLTAAGVRLIDREPRIGAGGKLIAFLHPKSTGGILIELTQVRCK